MIAESPAFAAQRLPQGYSTYLSLLVLHIGVYKKHIELGDGVVL
jgi:hypothetical protein